MGDANFDGVVDLDDASLCTNPSPPPPAAPPKPPPSVPVAVGGGDDPAFAYACQPLLRCVQFNADVVWYSQSTAELECGLMGGGLCAALHVYEPLFPEIPYQASPCPTWEVTTVGATQYHSVCFRLFSPPSTDSA